MSATLCAAAMATTSSSARSAETSYAAVQAATGCSAGCRPMCSTAAREPDRIAAQAGRDFVHARDGVRDVVLCGTNRGGTPERDEVWADRIDQVARDCEIVHRRGR